MLGRLLLLLAALTLSSLTAPAAARNASYVEAPREINIPAGSLIDALDKLGDQSGIQIMFETALAEGVKVDALNGTFTVRAALARLLANSGLRVDSVNARTVVLRRAGSLTSNDSGAEQTRMAQAQSEEMQKVGAVEPETQSSQAPASSEGKEDKDDQLQEIIVTATKREERLQDVPLSMSVVTAEAIDERGLVSAEDYMRGIPGVSHLTGAGRQGAVFRGIDTGPAEWNNSGLGPLVATYFGETPTTTSAGVRGFANVDLKLVDIERVEVLRGPQGTSFGSSSMSGAVRTIPVAPKLDRFEGKVGAGYSVTSNTGGDNYNMQAVANLPLIEDKLAIRAVGYRYEESGYYRNVAGSDPGVQAALVIPFGAQAFAFDEEEAGAGRFTGGRLSALLKLTDAFQLTLSYLKQETEVDGQRVASGPGTYDQGMLQVAPEHVTRGQKDGAFDTDMDLANAMLEYYFGWANLLASYSYTDSGSLSPVPYTFLGIEWPTSALLDSQQRGHFGEIRLATRLDGPWNFLAGIYAEDVEDIANNNLIWYGDQATNFIAPGVRMLRNIHETREQKQMAAFGEVSWEFLPGLTLTGGVRAYEYDRGYMHDQVGPLAGPTGVHQDNSADASGTIFRGNLSYKPRDYVHLYAGWSQGFRLGQAQAGIPASVCDTNGDGLIDNTGVSVDSTRFVNSDGVDNYEVGTKVSLFDRRLSIDLAAFRMDWTDIPVSVLVGLPGSGCFFGYSANAGEARSEGVEFQAGFQATEAFRVDFGGSFINARLLDDVPGQGWVTGDRLPGSSEVTANLGLQYGFALGEYLVSVRADPIYVGPFYGTVQPFSETKAGDYVKVDASARVTIRNAHVDLFVRNLTNEDEFVSRIYNGPGRRVVPFFGNRPQPRTIGLQISYDF